MKSNIIQYSDTIVPFSIFLFNKLVAFKSQNFELYYCTRLLPSVIVWSKLRKKKLLSSHWPKPCGTGVNDSFFHRASKKFYLQKQKQKKNSSQRIWDIHGPRWLNQKGPSELRNWLMLNWYRMQVNNIGYTDATTSRLFHLLELLYLFHRD